MDFKFDFGTPSESPAVNKKENNQKKGINFGEIKDLSYSHLNAVKEIHIGKQKLRVLDLEVDGESDLVPYVYEGGYKIWECSLDLCEYILKNAEKFVGDCLELGCGASLPSICAGLLKCNITIQDYNESVLRDFSLHNLIENGIECVAYYGDWHDLKEIVGAKRFKVILSCETIYSTENYESFLDLVLVSLDVDGLLYLAAKSVYFGLDGSTDEFIKFSQSKLRMVDRVFIKDSSVKREIIVFSKI